MDDLFVDDRRTWCCCASRQGTRSQMRKNNKRQALTPYQLLFCGGLAGAVSRTVTAPLDRYARDSLRPLQADHVTRLKTMFQAGAPAGHPQYTSIMSACRAVMQEREGWRSFFKGNGTNVLKIAPETAVKFWAYERLKTMIPQDPSRPTILER